MIHAENHWTDLHTKNSSAIALLFLYVLFRAVRMRFIVS